MTSQHHAESTTFARARAALVLLTHLGDQGLAGLLWLRHEGGDHVFLHRATGREYRVDLVLGQAAEAVQAQQVAA